MATELRGLRILNTRPAAQAAPLSNALRMLGAEVLELPLLQVQPFPLAAEGRRWVMDLDRYDQVFFVSANAARLGLDAIGEFWPQWPHRLPVIGVGRATAKVLDDAGLSVVHPEQEDSDGVLALRQLASVTGQRILIVRGEEGRERIAEVLRARGARVDVLVLYRLVLPEDAVRQFAALPPVDWVVVTSPVAWRHWCALAGPAATTPGVVVVSERMRDDVLAAGCQHVRLAAGAGAEAICACFLQDHGR